MELLILYGLLAVGISFVCSMLEAALLSVPEGYVEALAQQGSRAGALLKHMKENIDRPLAAILTVNTIANTAGAAGVGAQAAVVFGGGAATGIATAVMTLSILFVSEIIPKTLGAAHSRGLAGFTAYATRTMVLACLPLVIIVQSIKRRLGYVEGGVVRRVEVKGTLRLARTTGALEQHEHEVMSNVLALPDIRLSRVLTPRTVMFSLPEETTVDEAIARHMPFRFSRIPVYEELPERVKGYVPRFEIYRASVRGQGNDPVGGLRRPVMFLPELATVGSALKQMLGEDEHIAMVVDEYGALEGLVTLEDLIETLLGAEIVDETDSVIDMQELAKKKRSRDEEE